jgi:hypothetical protein
MQFYFKLFFFNIYNYIYIFKICWHPTKESIIAFGTKDGKVGVFDYMSNNKYISHIHGNLQKMILSFFFL